MSATARQQSNVTEEITLIASGGETDPREKSISIAKKQALIQRLIEQQQQLLAQEGTSREELLEVITQIHQLNTEIIQQAQKYYSRVPNAYWEMRKKLGISHGCSDYYLFLNNLCYDKKKPVKFSLRTLAKQADVARSTQDDYILVLEAAGLLKVERHEVTGKIEKIFLTDLVWFANQEMHKPNYSEIGPLPDTQTPSQSTPQRSAGLTSLHTSSSSSLTPSSSSFSSQGGPISGPGGPNILPVTGPEIGPQSKNQDQRQPVKNTMIRSDQTLTDLSEMGQRIAMLAQRLLPSLEAYDSPKSRKTAEQSLLADSETLAQHCLIAQVDEKTIERCFQFAPESTAHQKYVLSFQPGAFIPPVQVRFFSQKGFFRLKQIIEEMTERCWQTPKELAEAQQLAEKAHQEWLAEQEQNASQVAQEPEETNQEEVVTHVTEDQEVSDVDGQVKDADEDFDPFAEEEVEGTINQYADVEGMKPVYAIHFLKKILEYTPELQPQKHNARPGTTVIDICWQGQISYLIEWGDYEYVLEQMGKPIPPRPSNLGYIGAAAEEDQPVIARTRTQRKALAQAYLAACARKKDDQREDKLAKAQARAKEYEERSQK